MKVKHLQIQYINEKISLSVWTRLKMKLFENAYSDLTEDVGSGDI